MTDYIAFYILADWQTVMAGVQVVVSLPGHNKTPATPNQAKSQKICIKSRCEHQDSTWSKTDCPCNTRPMLSYLMWSSCIPDFHLVLMQRTHKVGTYVSFASALRFLNNHFDFNVKHSEDTLPMGSPCPCSFSIFRLNVPEEWKTKEPNWAARCSKCL